MKRANVKARTQNGRVSEREREKEPKKHKINNSNQQSIFLIRIRRLHRQHWFDWSAHMRCISYDTRQHTILCVCTLHIKYIDKILFLIENRITSKATKTHIRHIHTRFRTIERENVDMCVCDVMWVSGRNLWTSISYMYTYSSICEKHKCTVHTRTKIFIPSHFRPFFSQLVWWSFSLIRLLLAPILQYIFPKTKKCVWNIIFANLKNRSMWVI